MAPAYHYLVILIILFIRLYIKYQQVAPLEESSNIFKIVRKSIFMTSVQNTLHNLWENTNKKPLLIQRHVSYIIIYW